MKFREVRHIVQLRDTSRISVTNRGECHARNFAVEHGACMCAAHVSHANDAEAYCAVGRFRGGLRDAHRIAMTEFHRTWEFAMDKRRNFLHYSFMSKFLPPRPEEWGDIRVFENKADWSWGSSQRDHYNLWIALEGAGCFTFRSGLRVPFAPGSAFLLPPFTAFEAEGVKGIDIVNFTLHYRPTISSAPSELWLGHLERIDWLEGFCSELALRFAFPDHAGKQAIVHGIGYLWANLVEGPAQSKNDPHKDRIMALVARIRRDPASAGDVESMAASCALSPAHFTRLFRRITGLPPNRFVIRERIYRAKSLLRDSNATLEEISERLGYTDLYFFSRQFRTETGLPPGAYRQAAERAQERSARPAPVLLC